MSADEGGMAPRKAAGSPRRPARGGRRRDSLRAEQLEYQALLGGRDVPTVPRHRVFLGIRTWWTPPLAPKGAVEALEAKGPCLRPTYGPM